MRSVWWPAVRLFVVLSIILGVAYPLLITVAGQLAFSKEAAGSLVLRDGKIIGSSLIAQKNESPKYFWPRPSASDFGAIPSGASNLGPTSAALKTEIEERKAKGFTRESLYASGSGLDPHISIDGANDQVARIVAARGLDDRGRDKLVQWIRETTEARQFGFLGEPRVNVLLLNLKLDREMKL